jgi:hypothetical protein
MITRTIGSCLVLLVASASTASARADDASEWRFMPYLWIASFEGTVGGAGGGGGGSEDARFDHAWDNLGLAGAMLNVGWRSGRWSASGDWTFARVSSDSPTRVPNLYSGVEGVISGNILQASAGYDLLEIEDRHLDLYAGARYYDLAVKLSLNGAALADASFRGDDQWIDGFAGLRWVQRFAGRWQGWIQADVGAGGSQPAWQAIAGIEYAYGWGSVVGGWRHLHTDYDSGAYVLDAALTGPYLGASFTF